MSSRNTPARFWSISYRFFGKTQASNTTDKHLLHKVQGLLMVSLKYLTVQQTLFAYLQWQAVPLKRQKQHLTEFLEEQSLKIYAKGLLSSLKSRSQLIWLTDLVWLTDNQLFSYWNVKEKQGPCCTALAYPLINQKLG